MPFRLFTYHSDCFRTVQVVYVSFRLFTYYSDCLRIIQVVYVSFRLFTYHSGCLRIIQVVYVPFRLFTYHSGCFRTVQVVNISFRLLLFCSPVQPHLLVQTTRSDGLEQTAVTCVTVRMMWTVTRWTVPVAQGVVWAGLALVVSTVSNWVR